MCRSSIEFAVPSQLPLVQLAESRSANNVRSNGKTLFRPANDRLTSAQTSPRLESALIPECRPATWFENRQESRQIKLDSPSFQTNFMFDFLLADDGWLMPPILDWPTTEEISIVNLQSHFAVSVYVRGYVDIYADIQVLKLRVHQRVDAHAPIPGWNDPVATGTRSPI